MVNSFAEACRAIHREHRNCLVLRCIRNKQFDRIGADIDDGAAHFWSLIARSVADGKSGKKYLSRVDFVIFFTCFLAARAGALATTDS